MKKQTKEYIENLIRKDFDKSNPKDWFNPQADLAINSAQDLGLDELAKQMIHDNK